MFKFKNPSVMLDIQASLFKHLPLKYYSEAIITVKGKKNGPIDPALYYLDIEDRHYKTL